MQKISTWIIAILMLLAVATPVLAQQRGVSITPVNTRVNMLPAESQELSLLITNRERTMVELQLTQGAVRMGSDGTIAISDPETEGVQGWLAISESAITLAPGESREVPFTVTVPDIVEEGSYFPTINVINEGDSPEGSGATINASLVHIVGINVIESQKSKSIEILDLTASGPLNTQEVEVRYRFQNITKGFVRPSARLQVIAPDGTRVFEEMINPDEKTMVSGQMISDTVYLYAEGADLSQLGDYKVQLLVTDSQFDTAEFAQTEFTMIPGIYMAAATLAVLVVLMLIWLLIMKRTGPTLVAERPMSHK